MKRASRFAPSLCAAATLLGTPRPAEASGPDPVVAALISAGATLVPIGVAAGLWTSERGIDEGVRFDVGMALFGAGAIVGPSAGQIYASGGGDAWVTFALRLVTGGIGLVGLGLWQRGESEGAIETGQALAAVGGIPTLLLAIYDIWDAADSAVESQRERGHGPSVQRAPARSSPTFAATGHYAKLQSAALRLPLLVPTPPKGPTLQAW